MWVRGLLLSILLLGPAAFAAADPNFQPNQALGADPSLDYAKLLSFGPWDDRNYALTRADVAVLPANDRYLPTVPAFFKILKRREMQAQGFPLESDVYPREIDKEFQYRFGGLIQGGVHHLTERGKYHYAANPPPQRFATDPVARNRATILTEGPFDGTLSDNETTIEHHPTDGNIVIAGSNGSGGQRMSYSTDGGITWGNSGALPGTCCDPAIEFTSNGAIAFAATLGQAASGCGFSLCSTVYWSFNNGQTWLGPVHTSTASSDKEFIHIDKSSSSLFKDRVYLTWHQGNVMQFARSTALPVQGGSPLTFAPTISFSADERGIGSDISTDRQGRVYYVYPSITTGSAEMYLLRSDDGGATFQDLNGATAGLARQIYDLHGRFDFAIPAMESRRVFIYAVVDVDNSGGPRDGRVYVAFTDENAAAGSPGNGGGSAAASHAWIQVVYSDDQGMTWTVATTPHSTADQTTVDRFQPWMDVDGLGNVHVGWQDTRNSGAGVRHKADWYYATSTDGGATWIDETRVSSVVSENINDGQEWGDYNGLSVSPDNNIIGMTWTDNRIVTPPSTTSQRSFAARAQSNVAGPSYQMGTSDGPFSLCAGDPVPDVDLQLTALNGFSDPVTLSTPGLNSAVFPSASFAPNPVTPTAGGVSSTLTMTTAAGAATGDYTVNLQGSGGSGTPVVRSDAFDVFIASTGAGGSTLVSPPDAAVNQPATITFNWNAAAHAYDYQVEVATDPAFADIVASTTTRTTSWTPPAFDTGTTYYWRVTARNACPSGDGLFANGFDNGANGALPTSATFSFTTQTAPGDCPAGSTIVLNEDFEGAATGWGPEGGSGNASWAITTAFPFAGTKALQGLTPAAAAVDHRYLSPAVNLPTVGNGLFLSFQSRQMMEDRTGGCYDGGFIEVSVNGGAYTQITTGLQTDPYDGPLGSGNPAAPKSAWCGDPQAYLKSVIDLAQFAGQSNVRFRFHVTSDASVGRAEGWNIDNVEIKRCD
ncbi:MAG: exo-alpha-sialidase [Xanthomonadales bacterium PRO6]|nr:exo-alpha-sialidase [Xanthomonadales bacterium PRO6]